MLLLMNVALAADGKVNFREIEGKDLSESTQLALYKIHSHLHTCDVNPTVKSKLSLLWVFFDQSTLDIKKFHNVLVSPVAMAQLDDLYQAALKNPNCSGVLVNGGFDKDPTAQKH